MSADTERARAFYGELFGWECEDPNPDFGGYANFTKDGVMVAGLMGKMEDSLPDIWSVYLETADAEATVATLKEKGGQVFAGPQPVGDLGVMVVAGDSTGAMVGFWESKEHTGFGVLAEEGAPCWFELLTDDLDGALSFYGDVVGWTTRPEPGEPGFRYEVVETAEGPIAGLMDASGFEPRVPPHWGVVLGVADTDATVARAVELGGSVLVPAQDSPHGRFAGLADPMGAAFNVVQVDGTM
jgi:hypothetical protein